MLTEHIQGQYNRPSQSTIKKILQDAEVVQQNTKEMKKIVLADVHMKVLILFVQILKDLISPEVHLAVKACKIIMMGFIL